MAPAPPVYSVRREYFYSRGDSNSDDATISDGVFKTRAVSRHYSFLGKEARRQKAPVAVKFSFFSNPGKCRHFPDCSPPPAGHGLVSTHARAYELG